MSNLRIISYSQANSCRFQRMAQLFCMSEIKIFFFRRTHSSQLSINYGTAAFQNPDDLVCHVPLAVRHQYVGNTLVSSLHPIILPPFTKHVRDN